MTVERSRRRKSKLRARKLRLYLYSLIPLGLAVLFLRGSSGFINQYKLSQKKKQLEQQEQHLREWKARLEEEIERLRSDPSYIEKVAREIYGLSRPDEIVFIMKIEDESF